MRCYLFDIDGTVLDIAHRIHHIEGEKKDWRAFFAACVGDTPIPHIVELALTLQQRELVVFVSGRSDECRLDTEAQLEQLGFHAPSMGMVYMRRQGDHRPDNLMKADLLDEIIARGLHPIMAFDDRDQVVKMWRERGIPCAQVAPGAF